MKYIKCLELPTLWSAFYFTSDSDAEFTLAHELPSQQQLHPIHMLTIKQR